MTNTYNRSDLDQFMALACAQDALKQTFDHSVQEYVDNGLLPLQLADEMMQNTTGADIMKWIGQQLEDSPVWSPALRDLDTNYRFGTSAKRPSGILAGEEEPMFYDKRFIRSGPVIQTEGFIKINPSGTAEENPEFGRHFLGRWQIGIDLANGRDFSPTED